MFHLLQVGLGVLVPFICGHQQALLVALHVAKDDRAARPAGMAQDAGWPPQARPGLQPLLVELHGRESADALMLQGAHKPGTVPPARPGAGEKASVGGGQLTMRYCVSSMWASLWYLSKSDRSSPRFCSCSFLTTGRSCLWSPRSTTWKARQEGSWHPAPEAPAPPPPAPDVLPAPASPSPPDRSSPGG